MLAELQRQAMERASRLLSRTSKAPMPRSILVADADMFDDGFYVHPQTGQALADNAAFVLNALDNLSGDYALTELRSRAPAARPMTRVDDIETAARERLYAEQNRLEELLESAEARAERAGGASRRRALLRAKRNWPRSRTIACRPSMRAASCARWSGNSGAMSMRSQPSLPSSISGCRRWSWASSGSASWCGAVAGGEARHERGWRSVVAAGR